MVKERTSINKAAMALVELIEEGGEITAVHLRMADRLRGLAQGAGVYRRKYDNHEERVINRHINLYKNKIKQAKSEGERARFIGKLAEQQERLKSYQRNKNKKLDLDGL